MAEEASFMVNLGDIVQLNQRFQDWYQFFEVERDLLPQAPFVLVPGNHETWWDQEFGALMLNRFFRAGETGGTGHHSKDAGPIHMVFLDVYWGEDLLNKGLEWLRTDLSALTANQLAVVFLHEPPISFGAHRPRPAVKQLIPIFQELGVAAVIAGHSHVYEHFLIENVHYITAGGGGAGLHEANLNVFKDQEQYLIKNSSEHHYLLLTINKASVVFTVKRLSGETLEEWAVPLPIP
jgi:predicted phosphodiesterase